MGGGEGAPVGYAVMLVHGHQRLVVGVGVGVAVRLARARSRGRSRGRVG